MVARVSWGPEADSVVSRYVLTDEDRRRIAWRSRVGLCRALAAQAATGALVVVAAAGIGGFSAGVSALAGAVAYLVPNALFALRLLLGFLGPQRVGSLVFFWAEALKLAAVTALLGLMAFFWGEWLVWPAFLLGLLGTMKGYVLLMALKCLP